MSAPASIAELLNRSQRLAGLTLGELAAELQIQLPANLLRDKGLIGQMLEQALGASSGSKAEPDFPQLGIELKSLPIDAKGKPLESTYVCTAPLTDVAMQQWHNSWVCRKLSHVLWVPIWAERSLPLCDRVIGSAFLWQPDAEQALLLQQDWEELMELIVLGGIHQIRGAHGKVLQLRPKAANSKALTQAVGRNGEPIQTLPRGFYLKAAFTAAILQHQFGVR
ncbi:DNA mismatch repair endonuclease MutH [Rheinheimera sp.]|uniref:DNA mismatch repair endonuclease MutH n=1 Tax=Rheinheimera sp. TaxID=1869214 RepID=UPI0027BA27EE|nr:DNA mismatch repair endonuclease MutH [Rheinheimera sp.]